MKKIIINKPNDLHIHLRDNNMLNITVKDAEKRFSKILVMPNLINPVVSPIQALSYKERILKYTKILKPEDLLMTIYLTNNTTKKDIIQAKKLGIIGGKLYPSGVTTNSLNGIKDITKIFHILEVMEKYDFPLLIHGEIPNESYDIFDREKIFIDKYLLSIIKNFSNLRIVMEHITTKYAVDIIKELSDNIASTITAHHLLLNRNDIFLNGKINPHHFCAPILKRTKDQDSLIKAAISGNKKFFLGSDSAPHDKNIKECHYGCAGIYTGNCSIELYTEIFDKYNSIHMLENFSSCFGENFYNLNVKKRKKIILEKKNYYIPKTLSYKNITIIPFQANKILKWRLKEY